MIWRNGSRNKFPKWKKQIPKDWRNWRSNIMKDWQLLIFKRRKRRNKWDWFWKERKKLFKK